jgi:hypothetical protein
LTEAEWALFRAGLDLLRDGVEGDISAGTDDTETGVPVFDRLTPEQKLALLSDTAHALREPSVPTPAHTAANEGAVMAVLNTLRGMVEAELDEAADSDNGGPAALRLLLRAVAGESDGRVGKLPSPTRSAFEVWEHVLDDLRDRLLWDNDFNLGDEFLDLPPDEARAQLRALRIDPGYYRAVPPEPGDAGLTAARQTLARLLGLPVPDDDGLYPALVDLYHDLAVGPVPPEATAAWGDNPWVEAVGSTEPGWDCDYPTWVAEYSRAVPTTPFQPDPAAVGTGLELPTGVSVVRYGGSWAVRDGGGSYWCGLVENGWTDSPDEDTPALTFPTEAEARAAYVQAERMYAERAARRTAALARLGRPG